MSVDFGLLTGGNALNGFVKTPVDYVPQALQNQSETNKLAVQPQLLNQQVQSNDLDIHAKQTDQKLKQLDILSNAAGGLKDLPDDNAVNTAYQTIRPQLSSIFPDLPPTLTKAEANSAYSIAISAKDRMANESAKFKMQGDMAIAGATLGLKQQENQISALKGQSTAITSGAPTAPLFNQYTGQGTPGANPAPVSPQTNAVPTSPQGQAPVVANAPNATTGLQPTPILFPAQVEGDKEQVKDWQEMKKNMSSAGASYGQTKNVINSIRENVKDRVGGDILPFAPGSSFVLGSTPSGQSITKDASVLKLNIIKGLGANGVSRLDIPIVNTILASTPDPGKYNSVNNQILDKFEVANEIVNNIAPKVVAELDKRGFKDPLTAQNVLNEIVNRSGIYDNKSGALSKDKLNNWQKDFNDILKSGLNQTGQNSQQGQSNQQQQQSLPKVGVNPNTGQQVNYQDFVQAAKQANPNATPQQIDQYWQQKYGQGQQQSNNQGPNTDKLQRAIGMHESGGNYQAIGPRTKDGDQAYGAYQIMGKNIAKWTREILGKPMTPKEFLADPVAQDKVAQAKLAQLKQQYGNDNDAAAVWFSGRPASGNNSRDVTGTSVPQYVQSVNNIMAKL
jgi:hypothetical protein